MSHETQAVSKLFGKLMACPLHRFPSPRAPVDAPAEPGVYVIYGPRGKTLHVGDTYRGRRGLCQRLGNHLSGQSSFTNKSVFLERHGSTLKERCAWLRKNCSYRYLVVHDHRMRILLEAYAIGHLCPDHIGLHQTIAS
jgi:hypothetical protein